MTTSAANSRTKGRGSREGSRTHNVPAPHDSAGTGGLMEDAKALQEALRDASGRASRLVVALRRQRKHTKLLQTTLTSLRQLQHLDSKPHREARPRLGQGPGAAARDPTGTKESAWPKLS